MHVHVLHTPHTGIYMHSSIKLCMWTYWVKQEQETGTRVRPLVGHATSKRNYRGPVLTGLSSGLWWRPDKSEAEATQSDSYYYPLEQKPGPLGRIGVCCAHTYSVSYNSCIPTSEQIGCTIMIWPNSLGKLKDCINYDIRRKSLQVLDQISLLGRWLHTFSEQKKNLCTVLNLHLVVHLHL